LKRGDLTGSRENPATYALHIEPDENAELWFHHGALDPVTGKHVDDPNFPGAQFEIQFKERYGVEPSGEFYDAYVLVKSFRDGLQKAIWINKGNPELRDRIVTAMRKMASDPESVAAIEAKNGKYDWYIGEDGDQMRDTLMTFITDDALRNLVRFNREALGLNSVINVIRVSRIWSPSSPIYQSYLPFFASIAATDSGSLAILRIAVTILSLSSGLP
jgi:hypothetical protein